MAEIARLDVAPNIDPDRPRKLVSVTPLSDRIFNGISVTAASITLVIVSATSFFLLWKALPAFRSAGVLNFFTTSAWNQETGRFGVFGLIVGTLAVAAVSLLVAVPFATGLALFTNEYAPGRIRKILVASIDLLAALPSILFGMWGLFVFMGPASGIAQFFADHFSALPIFRVDPSATGGLVRSQFIAGMVVGFMALPVITSVSRDVMSQCPRALCEGALGLGATRWGMIRTVILPFSRSGRVGAILLGFGRALGETIAVALILAPRIDLNSKILTEGGGTIAQTIAVKFGEANELGRSGLVAAGVTLFAITLAVNMIARLIVKRTQRFG